MNDGIKLSTQTSFMEKGTVQRRKSQFMKLSGLLAAQTLTRKVVVSKPFKITMLNSFTITGLTIITLMDF